MKKNIQSVQTLHLEGLKKVLDSCQLFPSEYLDEMISDYFNDPETQDLWFTHLEDDQPLAIGYCVPEKLTNGTYNLLAIGVAQEAQRRGIAREMMEYIEQKLRGMGARILIVETSSDAAQLGARQLYQNIGYIQEAVIRDFWNDGEDKVVFWKRL